MNPVRIAFALFALLLAGAEANAQQGFYPREWFELRSGLFNRNYITAPDDLEQPASTGGWLIGRGQRGGKGGRMVFGAATVDSYCQQEQVPEIQIIEAPRTGRVSIDHGRFISSGVAGGSTYCVGRSVRGARIFFTGRARAGDRVVVRVRYPAYGASEYRGFIQDHVIPITR